MPVTLPWHNFHRIDTDNTYPFMWDIRHIVPAEAQRRLLFHCKKPGTPWNTSQKGQAVSPLSVFVADAGYDFSMCSPSRLNFYYTNCHFIIHFHSQQLQRSSEKGEMSFCCQPLSWWRRDGGAVGFWVPAPGIVPTAWGNPGCPKFSTACILVQNAWPWHRTWHEC